MGRVEINKLQRNWDELGKADPFWAILFEPGKKAGGWQVDDFFATGERDVEEFMARADQLELALERGRALDFGCGAGRLTQALADHFKEVDGVDIAPSMVELANRYNRHGDRCHFHVNCSDDLSLFSDDSFDLVCSLIVLQHIDPQYVRNYLKEFLRVLRPGGAAVFSLPSHPANTVKGLMFAVLPPTILNTWRRLRYGYRGIMELHGLRREQVMEILQTSGGRVCDVQQDPDVSLTRDWHSYRYWVVKEGKALSLWPTDATTVKHPT
jgi:SAM-dependent methyltransferase